MLRMKVALILIVLGLSIGCNRANQPQQQAQPENQQPPATQEQAAAPTAGQPAAAVPAPATTSPGVQPAAAPRPAAAPAASTPTAAQMQQSAPPSNAVAPAAQAPAPRPQLATIPSGTKLMIRLESTVDTAVNKAGDAFKGIVDEDISVDGKVAIPRGSAVSGKLLKVVQSGRVEGRAELAMELNKVEVGGTSYSMATKTFSVMAESSKKEDAMKIGGGAGIGAAIGAIAGGGKGAAIGAAVGGGAGTAVVVGTRGKEIKYAPEQKLTFTLSEDLKVPLP
ncbi:MAG: hypothetical protein H6Q04_829 [Acidobacteria bacterium]|nr:hypothetical protein [Acidobacteriota bacterium]